MCRKHGGALQYFLVHPGGPFYARKNDGVWSIPKGLPEINEELLACAQREFLEETGITAHGPFHGLGTVKTKSGKVVHAWAFEGAWDESQGITSNNILIDWPRRSGKKMSIPEVDRAAWLDFEKAHALILESQRPFLQRARVLLGDEAT